MICLWLEQARGDKKSKLKQPKPGPPKPEDTPVSSSHLVTSNRHLIFCLQLTDDEKQRFLALMVRITRTTNVTMVADQLGQLPEQTRCLWHER
jgi:hypothetical protein